MARLALELSFFGRGYITHTHTHTHKHKHSRVSPNKQTHIIHTLSPCTDTCSSPHLPFPPSQRARSPLRASFVDGSLTSEPAAGHVPRVAHVESAAGHVPRVTHVESAAGHVPRITQRSGCLITPVGREGPPACGEAPACGRA